MGSRAHPQPKEARQTLASIFRSKQFSGAERRKRLLEYLVEEALSGRGADVKEFRIGVDVYGRDPTTYDPRTDSVVRVDIGRLRTKLHEYYSGEGRNDRLQIELPKGSYAVSFQASEPVAAAQDIVTPPISFPLVATLHTEPDSVNGHADPPQETAAERNWQAARVSSPVRGRVWRPAAAAVGVLLVTGSLVIAVREGARRHARVGSGSLAIIPFVNLTNDPANDYFSDGLTDDLTVSLGKIRDLRVVSRSSTSHFKNKHETPQAMGQSLGVQAILEGSVQGSGSRIRVIAQLNSTVDGSQIWSDVFDGDQMDTLRLEDRIAQALANRLGGSIAARANRDPAVHDLLLRGRFFLVQQTPEAVLRSMEYFQQGLARDPRDPECNGSLAAAYVYLANMGQKPAKEAVLMARSLIRKALDADPSYGAAHLMLGYMIYMEDHDWPGAELEFKKAVELSPNSPDVRNNYGAFLMYRGRFDEALVQFSRGREIDPLNVMPHANMGSLYSFMGDYPHAEGEYRTVLKTNPKHLFALVMLADVLAYEGKYDAAFEELDRARTLMAEPGMAAAVKASLLARQGKRDQAREILTHLDSIQGAFYMQAMAYMELGDRDSAFRFLEEAYRAHDGNLITLPVNRTFLPVHSDPRFQDLLRRMGALSSRKTFSRE